MLKIIDYKLPKETFGQKINLNLLAQANHVYSDRLHVGLRSTKTRSEINRTTKKVYKQKGTGGARHGSRRANLFVGGGIVFGPRPVKRELNLSQGIKSAAKVAALSAKSAQKEVLVISGIPSVSKTKDVAGFLTSLKARRFTFLLAKSSQDALKFIRNVTGIKVGFYDQVNAHQILTGGTILIDEAVFAVDKKNVPTEKKVKSPVAKRKEAKK